jgi:hypothetical protein
LEAQPIVDLVGRDTEKTAVPRSFSQKFASEHCVKKPFLYRPYISPQCSGIFTPKP